MNRVLCILSLAWNTLLVRKLNDVGAQVVVFEKQCNMVREVIVINNDVHVGNMFQLDTCTTQCNNSSVFAVKRYVEALAS